MTTNDAPSRVLVFGAGGYLGRTLVANLRTHGVEVIAPPHTAAPVENSSAIARVMREVNPDAVVNLAATRPQANEAEMMTTNAAGAANIAHAVAATGSHLLHVSTDCVLDGMGAPYKSTAPRCPSNVYGRSKAAGEATVQTHAPGATIVRTSLIWDPQEIDRATKGFAERLHRGEPLRLFEDEIRCPLDRPTLAEAIARLLAVRHAGVVNVAGREALSRHAFGTLLLEHFDIPGRERAEIARLVDLDQPEGDHRAPDLTLDVRETEQLLSMKLAGPRERLAG